eukprot:CAMPEP_0118648814 /NCGR_PEP_ID=MMETSP0785-20121206/9366_1 /TAXON_ID=91992 /ORGANISM="Bolidomonas pacifica, Strain CCMP 1866" /LENGTH=978 /DNA_ID=CAMNT_0006541051 /DNA_START=204 /DNA_END=3136 /DNA_ORIENTATION=+
MVYLYIILQLVGLLWAFVTNAAVSLGLMVAKEIGSGNLSALVWIRKREMVATFYVIYSTFRVVMQFVNCCVSTVWQSLNDFPKARRQITGFAAEKATLILVATFTPIVLISIGLIVVGAVCDEEGLGAKLFLTNIGLESEMSYDSLDYFCNDSPFKYITFGYHLPRRILTLVVVLSGIQLVIVILNQFPDWAIQMRKQKKAPFIFDILTSILLILSAVFFANAIITLLKNTQFFDILQPVVSLDEFDIAKASEIVSNLADVVVEEAISSAFEKDTKGRSTFFVPDSKNFEHLVMGGHVLLLLWVLYVGAVALTLVQTSRPVLNGSGRTLRSLFRDLKHSFLVFVFMVFGLEMMHPDFGFIEAQIDLTLLTLAIPAMQVTLGICVQNAMKSSRNIFLFGLPASASLAALSVYYSRAGGPGSFFIVTLHVFTKILQFFGHTLELPKEQNKGLTKSNSLGSIPEGGEGKSQVSFKGDAPVTRKRQLTWFGINVGPGGGSETKQDKRKSLAKTFSIIQEVEDEDEDEDEEEENEEDDDDDLLPNLTSPGVPSSSSSKSKRSPSKVGIPAELKNAIIKKHKEKEDAKRARRVSSTMKPKNMFNGFARFGTAFAVIVTLAVGFIAASSHLQQNKQWYPDLIDIKENNEGIVIKHAYVVDLEMKTQGPEVRSKPEYASCGMTWFGLSLLDYAFLAEASYFDPDNSDLDEVVRVLFDPKGEREEKLFEVTVPPPEMRRQGVAQYMDAYSKELNVSVVAIRGTDVGRMSDLVEDVKIFKEPVLLSMLSVLFPTISIWPDSVAAFVIHSLSASLTMFGLSSSADYYKGVLDYVREIKDRQVVLTGHSLGGGLARIVAAVERLPNVAFSPPGVAQSYYKFVYDEISDFDELRKTGSMLHHMSIAVLPENDPVPTVDTQVGLIQRVGCDSSKQAMQNACHMLEGTISELLHRCGDSRGRFVSSSFKFGLGDIVRQTWKIGVEQRTSIMAG